MQNDDLLTTATAFKAAITKLDALKLQVTEAEQNVFALRKEMQETFAAAGINLIDLRYI